MLDESMSRVSIELIDASNWRESLKLEVEPDQLRFVSAYAPVAMMGLAKAYINPEGLTWCPHAIRLGNVMVGFFILASASEQPSEIWLFHFFIDKRLQRQGLGKRALECIVGFTRSMSPPCATLKLCFHPENLAAERLYVGSCFEPIDETRHGEQVFVRRL
jgi:diamine N-acetyltransferase